MLNLDCLLRSWIGLVGSIAIFSTYKCFTQTDFIAHLYTNSPKNVNPLASRLFGLWTIVAGTVRIFCAINFTNRRLYELTFLTFFIVLVHFLSEIYYFKSSTLSKKVIAPIGISGVSMIMMTIGYFYFPLV